MTEELFKSVHWSDDQLISKGFVYMAIAGCNFQKEIDEILKKSPVTIPNENKSKKIGKIVSKDYGVIAKGTFTSKEWRENRHLENDLEFRLRYVVTIVTYLLINYKEIDSEYRTENFTEEEIHQVLTYLKCKVEDYKLKRELANKYNEYIRLVFMAVEHDHITSRRLINSKFTQDSFMVDRKFNFLLVKRKNAFKSDKGAGNEESALGDNDDSNNQGDPINSNESNHLKKGIENKIDVLVIQKSSTLESIYVNLKKDFSSIDLLLPGTSHFPSMDSFIDLDLKSPSLSNNEKIHLLKQKLDSTIDFYKRRDIAKDIIDLEDKEPRVVIASIINRNQHVYIQGPAGSGKSTLLRWGVFACTQGTLYFTEPRIPIYVELKFYKKPGDLVRRINSFIKKYKIKDQILQEFGLLLLIDGYDEFHLDEGVFFNELTAWIGDKKAQVVFAGREEPKVVDKLLRYSTFSVNPITPEQIKSALVRNLGIEQGLHWYGIVETNALEHYLTNPLYLTFVISLIKKEKDQDEIISLIVNKGKLLSNLIIDQFMAHEKSKNSALTDREWLELKSHLIKSLAHLAYEMTFKLKNSETLSQKEGLKSLNSATDSRRNRSSQEIFDILCYQNFLKIGQEDSLDVEYTFVKKEIRLFFASYHFSKKIKNRRQFERGLDSLIPYPNAKSTISSVEEYTLGLVSAEIILPKKFLNRKKDYVFYSPRLNQNFHYQIALVKNGNLELEEGKVRLEKSVQFIGALIESYLVYLKTSKKRSSGEERLILPLVSTLGTRVKRTFTKNGRGKKMTRDVQMANGFLISTYGGFKELLELFVEIARHHNLAFYFNFFDRLQSFNSSDKEFGSQLHNIKYTYAKLLLSEKHIYKLSVPKRIELSYNLFLEKNDFALYINEKSICRREVFEFIQSYSSEFYSYFVEQTSLQNTEDYFKLFRAFLSRGAGLFSLDSEKMSNKNRRKWVYILTQACLSTLNDDLNAYWRLAYWSKKVDLWYIEKVTAKLELHLEVAHTEREKILAAKSLIQIGHLQYISVFKEYIHPSVQEENIKDVIEATLQLSSGYLEGLRTSDSQLTSIFLPILNNEQFSIEMKKHFLLTCASHRFMCTEEIQEAALAMYYKTFIRSNMNYEMVCFMKSCNRISGRIEFLKDFLTTAGLWDIAYSGIIQNYIYHDYNPEKLKQYRLKIEPFWNDLIKQLLNIQSLARSNSQTYWLYVAGSVGDQEILAILHSIKKDELEPNTQETLTRSVSQIGSRLREIARNEKN